MAPPYLTPPAALISSAARRQPALKGATMRANGPVAESVAPTLIGVAATGVVALGVGAGEGDGLGLADGEGDGAGVGDAEGEGLGVGWTWGDEQAPKTRANRTRTATETTSHRACIQPPFGDGGRLYLGRAARGLSREQLTVAEVGNMLALHCSTVNVLSLSDEGFG